MHHVRYTRHFKDESLYIGLHVCMHGAQSADNMVHSLVAQLACRIEM